MQALLNQLLSEIRSAKFPTTREAMLTLALLLSDPDSRKKTASLFKWIEEADADLFELPKGNVEDVNDYLSDLNQRPNEE